jgi:hypothetical protein
MAAKAGGRLGDCQKMALFWGISAEFEAARNTQFSLMSIPLIFRYLPRFAGLAG